ncbi:MAG: serine/threonine protein phosphatase [Alphaproteobacteria bacterium]|nr:MAG: serine/threonine protein phosphatase [Alphaproteobacteria bacterium]
MFRNLFQKRRAKATTPGGAIPQGERVYAVGDIHGRLDLLETLLQQIDADDAGRSPARTMLLFLGDLMDRGPQSAQVVERLRRLKNAGANIRLLLGNHEEVFLLAVAGDLEALRFFSRIGGKETILSYGIDPADYDRFDYPELMAAFQASVPASHIAFIQGFEDLIVVGDYAFVHAGVRPDAALDMQATKDLRWIRQGFLDHATPLERIIVHGHTIAEEVEWRAHRIGIDTGAYTTGRLTALALEGDQRWLIQT